MLYFVKFSFSDKNIGLKICQFRVCLMFSKELTQRRSNALIKRRDYVPTNKSMQVKLEFSATLKGRERGSNIRWSVLKEI